MEEVSKSLVPEANEYQIGSKRFTFDAIKACYPPTIKGELFSLLCYQPEAFPASLKTLTRSVTGTLQCLPQI